MKKLISFLVAIAMLLTAVPAISLAEEGNVVVHYYGDVNFDEELNTADATIILKIAAGMLPLTEEQTALTAEHGIMKADANMDGEVNTADASFILKYAAGMTEANTYGDAPAPTTEPTGEPTGEPTSEPTGEPTAEPTSEPTAEPTSEPTAEPTSEPTAEPDAYITINCYDTFNEQQAASTQMGVYDGENTINADNIVLPEDECSYFLEDASFTVTVTVTDGVPSPAVLNVNVIPVVRDEQNNIYKVILTVKAFNKINDDLAGYYALGKDLDFECNRHYPIGWDKNDPRNNDATPFSGVFDGCGHTIENLYIYYTSGQTEEYPDTAYWDVGLFSQNTGTIRNLNVKISLWSSAYGIFGDVNVGTIAGINAGLIQGCRCVGSVGALDLSEQMRGGCGGICGTNLAIVTQCSFEGGAEGFYYIGGLVGKNFGQLTESYFAGGINCELDINYCNKYAVSRIGGLCGGSQGGTMRDCYVYQADCIKGQCGVGGMVGWVSGGVMKNIYVAQVNIVCVQGYESLCGNDAGYVHSVPQHSGLWIEPDDTLHLPSEFGEEWDMNGACHKDMPDLVHTRRPEGAFFFD